MTLNWTWEDAAALDKRFVHFTFHWIWPVKIQRVKCPIVVILALLNTVKQKEIVQKRYLPQLINYQLQTLQLKDAACARKWKQTSTIKKGKRKKKRRWEGWEHPIDESLALIGRRHKLTMTMMMMMMMMMMIIMMMLTLSTKSHHGSNSAAC